MWSCEVKKDGMLEALQVFHFLSPYWLMSIIVQQEYWVRDSLAKVFCCGAYDAVISVLVPLILMNAQVEMVSQLLMTTLATSSMYCMPLMYMQGHCIIRRFFSEQGLLSFVIVSQLLVSHNSCTCYCTCTPFLIMCTTQIHEILSEWPVGTLLWTTTNLFSKINFIKDS